MSFNIEVKKRVATFKPTEDQEPLVCGNSGYKAVFNFDEDWNGITKKTARFKWNTNHMDVEFNGNECEIPVITNAEICTVGVYAGEIPDGEDAFSTTDAVIHCKLGTRCGFSTPSAGTGANYTNEAKGYAVEAKAAAKVAEGYAEEAKEESAEVKAYDAYYNAFSNFMSVAGSSVSGAKVVERGVTQVNEADYLTPYKVVVLPNGLKTIGQNTFRNSSLEGMQLPPTLEKIENYGFFHSLNLKRVDVPHGVTEIQSYCFEKCPIEEIVLPDTVTSIGWYCFRETNLKHVVLGDGLTLIPRNLFYGCSNPMSVTLPKNLVTIELHAFYNFYGLTDVSIPKTVTDIGDNAFANCTSLQEVSLLEYGDDQTFPKLGTGAFNNVGYGFKILVPRGRKAELERKTNWATWAYYMQEE